MNSHRFSRFALVFLALTCILFSFSASAAPRGTGYGQLVVKRSANFGLNLTLTLWIDGRLVDRLQLGRNFSTSLPAGPHQIMASVSERRLDSTPIVRRIVIEPGTTTQLTAGFRGQDLVLR
jgi:hypothetical protein